METFGRDERIGRRARAEAALNDLLRAAVIHEESMTEPGRRPNPNDNGHTYQLLMAVAIATQLDRLAAAVERLATAVDDRGILAARLP